MEEVVKLLIGVGVLIFAFPLGNFLRNLTRDEQKAGQPWFFILTILGFVGGIVGLIILEDWLLFTSLFVAIVSSRSLIVGKNGKKKR